ncbi:hypothetical protein NDU88_005135 [Pleurodeles waltl]|uniref:Uncharacterized protein n=1 Tax=Pleurodeles waltl TaxID=8319 RepID=A0AAV7RNF1_PLEWA|nr:hypothetical protein NDU88_005135 [Pleurodeles waltl]
MPGPAAASSSVQMGKDCVAYLLIKHGAHAGVAEEVQVGKSGSGLDLSDARVTRGVDLEQDLSEEEVRDAIRELLSSKATGSSGLPIELYKCVATDSAKHMLNMLGVLKLRIGSGPQGSLIRPA